MLKSCLKFTILFVVFSSLFLFSAQPVLADRTINSVTLNGATSVTVLPSASITVAVNVTTNALNDKNWRSTSWNISGSNCINHVDHNGAGTYNESFTVTAPSSSGIYNISFIAYADSVCSLDASPTYILTGSIIVATPTPTPTSGPTATPTSTPGPGTPTATPTSIQNSNSSSSSTYYPSVSLNSYSPDPANKVPLIFLGLAAIAQGIIAQVEYTLTDGASWIQAQPVDGNFNGKDEHFTFTATNLPEGVYTVKVRAKSAEGVFTPVGSYASDIVTIATTPPEVVLDKITPNPTKNQRPILTGTVTAKLAAVARVEISLDAGKSWLLARRSGRTFSLSTAKLEDGNYPVIARATDIAGNIGLSDPQTLIIDTIPPIIGGVEQSIGPQVITSDKNGYISLVVGVETTIAVSMKGGVIEATIHSGDKSFPLTRIPNSNIWSGLMSVDERGLKKLSITAMDGAQNKTERLLNTVHVEEFGKVIDKNSQQPVENAKITVFFFERITQQWIPWEAASYGQTNPQQTSKRGGYSFILPPGKYYIKVGASGFNPAQSETFELSTTTVVNYPLQLTSRPKIELKLPLVGKVVLSLPQLTPPDSIRVKSEASEVPPQTVNIDSQSKTDSEKLHLLDLEGKEVTVESFRGKKLLLSFISPWSSLSQEQAPFLTETASALSEDQKMLVVILQEELSATQAFMKRGSFTFPVVADKDGVSANAYSVSLLPYHVFIDANGKIHSTHTGVLNKNELLKNLNDVP